MFYPPIYLVGLAILAVLFFCTHSPRVSLLILCSYLFICLCALADMAAHLP